MSGDDAGSSTCELGAASQPAASCSIGRPSLAKLARFGKVGMKRHLCLRCTLSTSADATLRFTAGQNSCSDALHAANVPLAHDPRRCAQGPMESYTDTAVNDAGPRSVASARLRTHARASACRMYGLVLTRNVFIIRECFRSLYVFLTRECVHTS